MNCINVASKLWRFLLDFGGESGYIEGNKEMKMLIKQVPVTGEITTNAYFYVDEGSKHGFLIDAAAESERLLQIIRANNWIIEKILLTHGHFDHIGAVAELQRQLGVPYYIHQAGIEMLRQPAYNLSVFMGDEISLDGAQSLADGEVMVLEAQPKVALKVIHVPGHTPDSVVFYDAGNKVAFVGDTIFKGSVGATHFPLGDEAALRRSIKEKIMTLPDDTVLYSGHSDSTTVAAERHNPFLIDI